MGLATINIRFTADLKGFSTEMQNSMRKMQEYGTKMNSLGKSLSTYVTLPLLAAGGAAVKFASDYNESLNKVEVAFGPASTSVKNFAKDSLTSFGIAEGSALNMAATYGDMATSMGLSQSEAAKMSTSLVGLVGDLASFKNISTDVANTAVSAIFTGETESIKKLGIVMTEANLQQFAFSKGIKTAYKDMDQATRVNLRYAFVVDASKNSMGDFVRTGGGAANQMRIFQESLKQVGQQFGSVILPYFTKAIVYVNGLIKGFSELSPATKAIIVGVAGIAAAIGPLMVGLGNVIGIIPNLITKFTALQATVMANPYMAAAVAIAALGLAIYAYASTTKEAVSSQTALNDAVKKGNENAAAEVSTLDKVYASATNVKLSTNERKKAVDDLQALYPAYFGNLKDEAILNGKAKNSYDDLREAIFNKSRAIAIDNELQNRANERVQKEIALRQKIEDAQNRYNNLVKTGGSTSNTVAVGSTGGVVQTFVDVKTKIAEAKVVLETYQSELKKFSSDNLKADQLLFTAKEDYLKKTGKLEDNEKQKLNDIKVGTNAIANTIITSTPGTIAFYEAQISGLQKMQKEQATSNGAWLTYQTSIDAIQKKIDALANTSVKLPKPELPALDGAAPAAFSLQDLEGQKAYFEEQQKMFSTTSDTYKNYASAINDTQVKINAITGVEETVAAFDVVKAKQEELAAAQERLAAIGQAVGASVAESFSGLSSSLIESFGLAKTGFEGFIGGLLQTVTKLIAMMLASSISQSIAGATASGVSTGPAAIFTTPAFIATAVSGVLAAFATIPKFETGGIFGGTSYYGDKILARVNSGEMVANNSQQKAIWGAMNGGSNVNVAINGSWDVTGDKLQLVLDRNSNKKNRGL